MAVDFSVPEDMVLEGEECDEETHAVRHCDSWPAVEGEICTRDVGVSWAGSNVSWRLEEPEEWEESGLTKEAEEFALQSGAKSFNCRASYM